MTHSLICPLTLCVYMGFTWTFLGKNIHWQKAMNGSAGHPVRIFFIGKLWEKAVGFMTHSLMCPFTLCFELVFRRTICWKSKIQQ